MGALEQREQSAKPHEVPASGGGEAGVERPEVLERLPVTGDGTGMLERAAQTVGHPFTRRRDQHQRASLCAGFDHVPDDLVEVGERGPSEFQDEGSPTATHRDPPRGRSNAPRARANSALSTEPPAPPRTALWESTKKRRKGGSHRTRPTTAAIPRARAGCPAQRSRRGCGRSTSRRTSTGGWGAVGNASPRSGSNSLHSSSISERRRGAVVSTVTASRWPSRVPTRTHWATTGTVDAADPSTVPPPEDAGRFLSQLLLLAADERDHVVRDRQGRDPGIPRAGEGLVRADVDRPRREAGEQRCESEDESRRRTVRVRNKEAATGGPPPRQGQMVRVDLGHEERHVGVHPVVRGVREHRQPPARELGLDRACRAGGQGREDDSGSGAHDLAHRERLEPRPFQRGGWRLGELPDVSEVLPTRPFGRDQSGRTEVRMLGEEPRKMLADVAARAEDGGRQGSLGHRTNPPRSARSASTNQVTLSATTTARGTIQGSCRPVTTTVAAAPVARFTVCCGRAIDEVGFTTSRATSGIPVVNPPRIPPSGSSSSGPDRPPTRTGRCSRSRASGRRRSPSRTRHP